MFLYSMLIVCVFFQLSFGAASATELDECEKSFTQCFKDDIDTFVEYCTVSNRRQTCWTRLQTRCKDDPGVCGLLNTPGISDAIVDFCMESDSCIEFCDVNPSFCENLCDVNSSRCVDVCSDHPAACADFCLKHPTVCVNFCKNNPEFCVDLCSANMSSCIDICELSGGACADICSGTNYCPFEILFDLNGNQSSNDVEIIIPAQINLKANIEIDESKKAVEFKGGEISMGWNTISYSPKDPDSKFTLTSVTLSRLEANPSSTPTPMLKMGGPTASPSSEVVFESVNVLYNRVVGSLVSIEKIGFTIRDTKIQRHTTSPSPSTSSALSLSLGMANSENYCIQFVNPVFSLTSTIGTFINVSFSNVDSGAVRASGGSVTFDEVAFMGNKITNTNTSEYNKLRHNGFFTNTEVTINEVTSDIRETDTTPNLFFSTPPGDSSTFKYTEANPKYILLYAAKVTKISQDFTGGRHIIFTGDFIPCSYTVHGYHGNSSESTTKEGGIALDVIANDTARIPFPVGEFPPGDYTFTLHSLVGKDGVWVSERTLSFLVTDPKKEDENGLAPGAIAAIIIAGVAVVAVVVVIAIVGLYFRKQKQKHAVDLNPDDFEDSSSSSKDKT